MTGSYPGNATWTRRRFLTRSAAGALALPSLAAVLSACGADGIPDDPVASPDLPLARPGSPVELPLTSDPISTGTPLERGASLQVYNWEGYISKEVLSAFESEFDVTVEWTTFTNLEDAIQQLNDGQVPADVFFPTTEYVSRLVQGGAGGPLIQPLNHELIPNLASAVWPSFSDPGPFYDLGARYSVPYTIYTTGVAYRRDRIDDDDAAAQGYEMLWNPDYAGEIAYYDSYRDALGMAMIRNGGTDPNSSDAAEITAAKEAILEILTDLGGHLGVDGTYARLPRGEITVSQAWSGDIVGAQRYLPAKTSTEVLGFWYPDDGGLIANDTMVIPASAPSPRLAHEFVNFLLDANWGYRNFARWNDYQPPFTSIDPASLIDREVVSPTLHDAVVTEEMYSTPLIQGQLSAEVDLLWLEAWSEIQAAR
jgi:spermidine/putrescine transport system substrate-binding protein